jgi:hypothetical protein
LRNEVVVLDSQNVAYSEKKNCIYSTAVAHTSLSAKRRLTVRNVFSAIFLMAVLCALAMAQNNPPASAPQPGASQQPATTAGQPASGTTTNPTANSTNQPQNNPLKIAPGSVIPVQLAKTVEAKKAKTGDEVVATVTMDMKTNSGDVLVPKDTKILGHVTEAQARNKEQKESELGIAFDHAVVKGDQMPLPMSIQAVIAPQTNNPATAGGNGNDTGGGAAPSPSSSMGGGRSGSMGGGSSSQASAPQGQNYPPGGGSSDTQPQASARPPITGNTQGVIGMPDVKLEAAAQNSAQGSVMTSEKSNVKIEKGTMLLLRVHQ